MISIVAGQGLAADRELSGWRVMMCCPGAWVRFQRREVADRVAAVLALLLHDHAQAAAEGGGVEVISPEVRADLASVAADVVARYGPDLAGRAG